MHTDHKPMAHFFSRLFLLSYVDHEALLLTNTLCQKIGSGAFKIAKDAFDPFWLPFLQSVLPFIDRRFAERPQLVQDFGKMLGAILNAYISIYLGNSPGIPNQTFVGCGCRLCAQLHDFFQDPSLEKQEYSLSPSDRSHVHSKLRAARVKCTHRTISMRVLVVRKADDEAQDRKEWAERRANVTSMLNVFDQETLLWLLGETEYEKIARLEVSAIQSEAPLSNEGSALSDFEGRDHQPLPILQTLRGAKRKIEHIDLTGDD